MTLFGYHASHEQYAPSELLEHVRHAERAGFTAAMCSDHFHPWTESQGHSGFAWSWLGAALQATKLTFGTVNAPGYRYHPAIIAQAAATLAEMYPGRFWLTIGSGEALNESITGEAGPNKAERNERLRECADVMRALWRGETVTRRGRIRIQNAKVYSLPSAPPLLFAAALTEETAALAGGWADGLTTVGGPRASVQAIIDAFRRGGGEGKPVHIQHTLSWAPRESDARRGALDQWRFSALDSAMLADLPRPSAFEAATRSVTEDDVAHVVRVSSELERHTEWLQQYIEMGIDAVYILNVNRNQAAFIDAFGERVLPDLAAVHR